MDIKGIYKEKLGTDDGWFIDVYYFVLDYVGGMHCPVLFPFPVLDVASVMASLVLSPTSVSAFCSPYGVICVELSICCQLCAALYQSL